MRHAWLPLALAFLFVCLSRIDDGGTNSMARFATLRAMADEHTFRIDNYFDWTQDWARTPDGHYFSNKAPGPTLIAFPVFWVIDKALFTLQSKHPDAKGRRQAPRGIHKVAISTIFQVLPFLILSLLALKAAYPVAPSREGYFFGLLAILFGNTAAMLMNSYMGNPFSGMAMMGVAYFYLRQKLAWMSFFFGWAVLADYSGAILVLPFFLLLLTELKERRAPAIAGSVAIGAAVPAALWCWYHIACFGSPFSLPYKYDVEALVGTVQDAGGLWGKISFLPRPEWVMELLVGQSRGILFTQPWLLFCLIIPFLWKIPDARLRRLFYFTAGSFFLLLSLNAGFPGWHGGGSPGPRYLAAALPLFGLFLPWVYDRAPRALRYFLCATVLVSLALRGLVYATWILPPPEPIWPYYLNAIQTPREWALLTAFVVALAGATGAYFKVSRRQAP